jgi:hypothetical protein
MPGAGRTVCDYIFSNGSRQQVYRKFEMPFSTPSDRRHQSRSRKKLGRFRPVAREMIQKIAGQKIRWSGHDRVDCNTRIPVS